MIVGDAQGVARMLLVEVQQVGGNGGAGHRAPGTTGLVDVVGGVPDTGSAMGDLYDRPDNTEFIAQMAQFSSLEQMQELNANFESVLALSQSEANSGATSLKLRRMPSPPISSAPADQAATPSGLNRYTAATPSTPAPTSGFLVRRYSRSAV